MRVNYKSVTDILQNTQWFKILIYPKKLKTKNRRKSLLDIYDKTDYLKDCEAYI